MKHGVVQQVGAPKEIYERPANTFVASFIGNPAMNLVPGRMEGGAFVAEHVRIEGLSAPDGPVTLGFRAEDAGLGDTGRHEIEAPIYTIELLGDATMVTVRIGEELVAVRAHKDFDAEIGDPVSLAVPAGICHVFDGETGQRIDG
jgi:multiple sugar transport system ATP-binding protein